MRKPIEIFATAALAGILLFGCSEGMRVPRLFVGKEDTAKGQSESALTLSVLAPQSSPAADKGLLALVESLDTLNPTVNISATLSDNYETDLAAALLESTPPDVFLVTGSMLSELARNEIVVPLSGQWIDSGQLLQAAARGIEYDGKTYCFPHAIHTLALVYNIDLFEEKGAAPPSSTWKWDDMMTAAANLTDTEENTVGLVLDANPAMWMPLYYQAGGQLEIEAQGNLQFDDIPAQMASEYFAGLFHTGGAVTPATLEAAWSGEAFVKGNVAMTIAGDWVVPYLEANSPPFRYAAAELPSGPAGKATIAFTSCLAVHADSPNRDLALQLAAQLTAPEVLPTWTNDDGQGLSVYSKPGVASTADSPELAPFLRSLRYAQLWRSDQFAREQANQFAEGVQMVSEGDMTPEEFWKYVQRGRVFSSSR